MENSVIDLDYFKDRRAAAQEILAVTGALLTQQCGLPAAVHLVPSLDGAARERVLDLGAEVFGPDGAVFDRKALDEVAADPDALFVALEIDGSVEGFCFGYYEEDGDQMVDGTDFFLDSALVAPRWQRHRLGWLAGAATLLLVTELEDVHRVGIAAWSEGDVDGLLSLYHRLGFVDATSHRLPHPCLAVTLLPERVDTWRALLGLPPADWDGRAPRKQLSEEPPRRGP